MRIIYFKYKLKSGDEVIITEAEHASNVLPWFKLKEDLGIEVKYIKLDFIILIKSMFTK